MQTVSRKTARILLFDPARRIFLFKIQDASVTGKSRPNPQEPFWVTPGGKIEEGESVLSAALRELFEETGLSADAVSVSAPMFYGEHVLIWKNLPTLLQEHFVVVNATTSATKYDGWSPEEKSVITEARWWDCAELSISNELVLPAILKKLVLDLAAGIYPHSLRTIALE